MSVFLFQWCAGQWTLPGTPAATGGPPRAVGAGSHQDVAEGADSRLDSGRGLSAGPEVLLTGGHASTRWGQ